MTTEANKKSAEDRSSMLIMDDLAAELDTGYIEETFEVAGYFWKMRTLADHEVNWASQYTLTGSNLAIVLSNRAPTLAVGIRAIGKTREGMQPIEEIYLDAYKKANGDLDSKVAALLLQTNPHARQHFFSEKLLEWLSARPPTLVSKLHELFMTLVARQNEASTAMGKSLAADGTSPRTIPTRGSPVLPLTRRFDNAGRTSRSGPGFYPRRAS